MGETNTAHLFDELETDRPLQLLLTHHPLHSIVLAFSE
jgi:hypothetical protein